MSLVKGTLELLLLSPLEDLWQITVIVQSGLPYPVVQIVVLETDGAPHLVCIIIISIVISRQMGNSIFNNVLTLQQINTRVLQHTIKQM